MSTISASAGGKAPAGLFSSVDLTVREGVAILDRTHIPRAFRRAKPTLTAGHVTDLYTQARRSTTWQPPSPHPAPHG